MADSTPTVPPPVPVDEISLSTDKPADSDGSISKLQGLVAQATAKYTVKDYSAAAELYSHATELQASINGEMSLDNAELLFSYGKCLYFVAVAKSDVLGAKVAGEAQNSTTEKEKKSKKEKEAVNGEGSSSGADATTGGDPHSGQQEMTARPSEGGSSVGGAGKTGNQPFFQFTGDENFTDSEDEAEGEEGEEAEEDDFQNAFEVLDLARVLLLKKLDVLLQQQSDKNDDDNNVDTSTTDAIKAIKERLADAYDLQAEISLEGEKFANAVSDLKAALALKQELYPQESSMIAECHYKLSLSLEFASVIQQTDLNGQPTGQAASVDEEMRQEAAREMELAIESCEMRVKKEDAELAAIDQEAPPDADPSMKKEDQKANIDEVKDMVQEMRDRLADLRRPPVSVNDPQNATGVGESSTALSGILGQILGESGEEQVRLLQEATKGANDLSGLVRKNRKEKGVMNGGGGGDAATSSEVPEKPTSSTSSTNGAKRKAVDFADEVEVMGTGKKARVEDVEENGS